MRSPRHPLSMLWMRCCMRWLLVALAGALASTPRVSSAGDTAKSKTRDTRDTAEAKPFCAPEIEAVSPNGDVCYLDGGSAPARRTLVIFLHGAIAKNTTWSWNHERMILKLAKAAKVEVLFPR